MLIWEKISKFPANLLLGSRAPLAITLILPNLWENKVKILEVSLQFSDFKTMARLLKIFIAVVHWCRLKQNLPAGEQTGKPFLPLLPSPVSPALFFPNKICHFSIYLFPPANRESGPAIF